MHSTLQNSDYLKMTAVCEETMESLPLTPRLQGMSSLIMHPTPNIPCRSRLILDATRPSPLLSPVKYSGSRAARRVSRLITRLYHDISDKMTQDYTTIMGDEELLVSPLSLTPHRDLLDNSSVPFSVSPLCLDESEAEAELERLERRWLINGSSTSSVYDLASTSPERWSDIDLSSNELYHLSLPAGNWRSGGRATRLDQFPATIPVCQLEEIEAFSQQHFPTSTDVDPEPLMLDQPVLTRQPRSHRLRTQLRRLSKILAPVTLPSRPDSPYRRKSSVSSLLERVRKGYLPPRNASQTKIDNPDQQCGPMLASDSRYSIPRIWRRELAADGPDMNRSRLFSRLYQSRSSNDTRKDLSERNTQQTNAAVIDIGRQSNSIPGNLSDSGQAQLVPLSSAELDLDTSRTPLRLGRTGERSKKSLERRCREYRGRRYSSPWWRENFSRETRETSQQTRVREHEQWEERMHLLGAGCISDGRDRSEGRLRGTVGGNAAAGAGGTDNIGMWDVGGDAWRTVGAYM